MRTLEILLSRRWILKTRDRDLYYQVKEQLASGKEKKFLNEKLGYQLIVNPYLIKVEKIPASPQNWMGILEFKESMEYVFFCIVLMFLEDKETEEQFVLSSLTEYIQSQCRMEQVDWTMYRYRRQLIKVLKYCVSCGILDINDGIEEDFARDIDGEVLYENTGTSKYFMRNFTTDIMEYKDPEDFEKAEWIGVDEDKGIVRRQRVYRRLLMTMGMYRTKETEEDFAYVRNYRNMMEGDLSEWFHCELHVHGASAFLVLRDDCRLGRRFPEDNTLSDIVLLFDQLLREQIREERVSVPADERIRMSAEAFQELVEECKRRFGGGFNKTYREMTFAEFSRAVTAYMEELALIEEEGDTVIINSAAGKIVGRYPEDFQGSNT